MKISFSFQISLATLSESEARSSGKSLQSYPGFGGIGERCKLDGVNCLQKCIIFLTELSSNNTQKTVYSHEFVWTKPNKDMPSCVPQGPDLLAVAEGKD